MEVELDSMWCTRLMPGLGSGVTGGDGAISIDLKDGRNLFMWGDSFFGDVVDDKRSKDSKFVMGNTFTIINEKGELETLYSGDLKNPSASLFFLLFSFHLSPLRAEGPEAPSPGQHPGYKRNQPYCYGAVLWSNGPTYSLFTIGDVTLFSTGLIPTFMSVTAKPSQTSNPRFLLCRVT